MQLGNRRPVVFSRFPSTGILDAFDRSNEGPPPSASWTSGVEGAGDGLKVSSNTVVTSGSGSGWWSAASFGPSSECYVTFSTVSGSFRLYVRLQQPGLLSTVDGYMLFYDGAGVVKAYRIDNGSFTQLGATITSTPVNGDSVGIQAAGAIIGLFRKHSGGWTVLGLRNDSTYASAGFVGMQLNTSSAVADDFSGGTST